MGPWWLTWYLCLYICEKCEMSRLWHTNTLTVESRAVFSLSWIRNFRVTWEWSDHSTCPQNDQSDEVTKVTHFHLWTIATKFLSNTSRPQSKFLSCQGGEKTEMISRGGAGLSLTLLHLRAALAHISVQVRQLWVFWDRLMSADASCDDGANLIWLQQRELNMIKTKLRFYKQGISRVWKKN